MDQQKKTIVSQVIHVAAVALVARPQDQGLHLFLGAADLLASWTAGVSQGNACRTVEEELLYRRIRGIGQTFNTSAKPKDLIVKC